MENLFRLVRLILIICVLAFTMMVMGGVLLFYYYSRDLPKISSLDDYSPSVVSEVYSNIGEKIGEFWTEKRYILSPEELPKTVVQAFVASEDDRFFEHQGIDYFGIVRAFLENLKAGHVVQGGSTITQQVTKSLLLTRERTIARKVKEAILATRIERSLNKDEILYLYLNQIFFGNRAYGIEAAARNYFHKSARELNIAEAAMIAGLAKAPSLYSPVNDYALAKSRQEYVIDRMKEVGYITREQHQKAKSYALKIYRAKTDKEFNYDYAPWFTENVRRMIQKKYGEQVPYTHGLKIETTLDLAMQKAADAAVERGLRELDRRQGWAGPLKKLSADEIDRFAAENHLKIMKTQWGEEELLRPLPADAEWAKIPTEILPDKNYEAVITAVKGDKKLEILIGNVPGIITVNDYGWARKRNQEGAGYDGAIYVQDPRGTFHAGDVILARQKIPGPSDAKKGYQEGVNYFSLEQVPKVESALFSYEPSSGFVRAIVGGRDFRQSEFDRTTQAVRQTGSAIKPLIYAAALDKGYTPQTIIEDAPVYYEYLPGRFWSPQNYGGGFKGPTPFRSGLVNSRNVVTVRILMDIGTHYVTAYARKLGITTPIQKYYSMALGANSMKLSELSRAYGTFVNGGVLPELVMIKRITDRDGRVLEEYQPKSITPYKEQVRNTDPDAEYNEPLTEASEVWIDEDKLNISPVEKKILYGKYIPEGYAMSPKTAATMVSLMNDIVNYGTGYKVKELKRPAAGKTGTTNDETDTWFVGFVPDLFAGVWVGFDEVQKIGGRETGGKTAAPIFLYYMQDVLKDRPVAQFDIPKDIEQGFSTLEDAPMDASGDAEAGGIRTPGSGAEFLIHDF
ncbi:MAG: PBP1A family penicillin-binding protein [Deltaproteobacteria bacterium]|nr:PBP1A family penicillin-binding protein [Deltaproteobacteria bacterium]